MQLISQFILVVLQLGNQSIRLLLHLLNLLLRCVSYWNRSKFLIHLSECLVNLLHLIIHLMLVFIVLLVPAHIFIFRHIRFNLLSEVVCKSLSRPQLTNVHLHLFKYGHIILNLLLGSAQYFSSVTHFTFKLLLWGSHSLIKFIDGLLKHGIFHFNLSFECVEFIIVQLVIESCFELPQARFYVIKFEVS